jgi:hypothetical protein
MDARMRSRRIKILADHALLESTDLLLWHDAAFRMDSDPREVARQVLGTSDILALRHPDRDQIEDEAIAIARHGYADLHTLRAQIATYRAAGFTQEAITSTGYFLRGRSAAVRTFEAAWWHEVERWCWRDQMSVDFALWRAGLSVRYIEGHYRHNPYAKWYPPVRGRR